ncbi:TrkA family potassium uptake protein [Quadrisphaera sp. DSM 44207]|uniref:potassium channel family protein n=1 Tax=Quadrisphaera sp. DSM 44207 TaxID=1881057 RepID=UPI00087E8065|nr:potassium channel protein [Quadrisphaera sp. DSM 44207]SDQ03933.1 Trk K+ transport system, NAD-binding component [Quadrisphaera sp. DSM 44207]
MSRAPVDPWPRPGGRGAPSGAGGGPLAIASGVQGSATIFQVLRRMRAPLIVLILIFAVSVLGLTLIPGRDGNGQPWRMSFFDAFYVMSYTATTIGFGEIPHPFTAAQRLWVTISIFVTVVGWAYALGSLLTLLQDRAFRQALALQHFTRKVSRLSEPFLLVAGYGQTGESLGRSFDALGRRFTVVDTADERVDALALDTYRADVPGLVGDARDPRTLDAAGLHHPCCEGVLVLTDDDETNLAVTMAVSLLRPDLPVVTRTTSVAVADRMRTVGDPTVINSFDRFSDHLRLALRSPAAYQLLTWLESGPGAVLPQRGRPPREGRWVVCGYGRFGRHFTAVLRDEGLEVVVVDPRPEDDDPALVVGDGADRVVLARAGVERAVGFVAGTDNDTTNLSAVAGARRANPDLFVVARQNQPASTSLFAAMAVDGLLVPTEVVAHEVYAQLSTPLLWRFLRALPDQGDAWAAAVVERLATCCGTRLEALWKVRLTQEEAPALTAWLERGALRLQDLLRSPEDRAEQLAAVPLLVLRGRECLLAPDGDLVLQPGDEMLLAGRPSARRALATALVVDAVPEYLVTGHRVPSGWVWRRFARRVLAPSS